jgi:hypothetical protein
MDCSGSYYDTKWRTLRLLAATWCLSAFVFVNVYSSVLISYLSAQYRLPEINSVNDLASSNHPIGTLTGTAPEDDILVVFNFKRLTLKRLKFPWNRIQNWNLTRNFLVVCWNAGQTADSPIPRTP